MNVTYNHGIDILYIQLHDESVYTTREIAPNCMVDIGADGKVIGIEISDACKTGIDALNVNVEQVVETATDLRPPTDEEARAQRAEVRKANRQAQATT
ncbi:MAG: DUF2283 domain-containing protein [Chloroflexota bacterium]|nr:DUF2283 domain-containing protein [Chloroflexota bacterium]